MKDPCKLTFHFSKESWNEKTHTSVHSPGTAPGHHNGGGLAAENVGKSFLEKSAFGVVTI